MVGMASVHSVQNWRDALEAAEGWEFDPIDTRERNEPEIGEIGAAICNELNGREGLAGIAEGVKKEDAKTVDAEMIHAAIDALEGAGRDWFSLADVLKVITSYNGKTGGDMRTLAEQHAEENGYLLVGLKTDDEYEEWYLKNGVGENEVPGETQGGGDLMWFNKNHW